MIHLFTDFGITGPYMGQMMAAAVRGAPGVPVVTLMADAPSFDPRHAAYLLAALTRDAPPGDVFVCVVDPGVGTARRPIAVNADGRLFVGPDNGLMALVARHADDVQVKEIIWKPKRLSASFHGRDLFAPVAARLAVTGWVDAGAPDFANVAPSAVSRPDWPDDLAAVIHIDPYGNVMTGLRADHLPATATITLDGRPLPRARTFGAVPVGGAMVYENSCGLLEIAVNQGAARDMFGLAVGAALTVTRDDV